MEKTLVFRNPGFDLIIKYICPVVCMLVKLSFTVLWDEGSGKEAFVPSLSSLHTYTYLFRTFRKCKTNAGDSSPQLENTSFFEHQRYGELFCCPFDVSSILRYRSSKANTYCQTSSEGGECWPHLFKYNKCRHRSATISQCKVRTWDSGTSLD